MKPANACITQDEVRSEIDRVDKALVDLLGERWGYIDRMWAEPHFAAWVKGAEAETRTLPRSDVA